MFSGQIFWLSGELRKKLIKVCFADQCKPQQRLKTFLELTSFIPYPPFSTSRPAWLRSLLCSCSVRVRLPPSAVKRKTRFELQGQTSTRCLSASPTNHAPLFVIRNTLGLILHARHQCHGRERTPNKGMPCPRSTHSARFITSELHGRLNIRVFLA